MLTLWTTSEIESLRNNEVPPTRTLKAARTKAFKLHIAFRPFGGDDCVSIKLTKEQRKAIAEDALRYRNKAHTADKFKVSRNYVLKCCKEFHIALIPSPHERLGEHIEYDGHNWSWKKGSWICTAKRVRESGEYNLGKVLWKKFHGIYPDARHDVRFKDGDRYNLKKSNLVLLTKAEAQTLRMKDPKVKAMTYATGCMGLLMNRINEMLTPGKARERALKAWKTSKKKNPERMKKAAETRRKNAEKRGFYYTDEARKRMSESHKGMKYGKRKNQKQQDN